MNIDDWYMYLYMKFVVTELVFGVSWNVNDHIADRKVY